MTQLSSTKLSFTFKNINEYICYPFGSPTIPEGWNAAFFSPTIQHFQDVYPQITGKYCLRCSFNLTFPGQVDGGLGWTSPYHFGINLGPVVLMCENYRSGLPWRLMRGCPYVAAGLRQAGFSKGWL